MLRTYWMTTVDPFQNLAALEEWMDQTVQQVFSSLGMGAPASSDFVPPVDIYEDADRLLLKVELPGLSEKDFKLTLENNVLTIRGERHWPEGFPPENFALVERPHGTFYRTVVLPGTVDPTSINATYANGILEITLNKKAEAKPKQIPVKFAAAKQLAEHATA